MIGENSGEAVLRIDNPPLDGYNKTKRIGPLRLPSGA
jgi:hypothetical protein